MPYIFSYEWTESSNWGFRMPVYSVWKKLTMPLVFYNASWKHCRSAAGHPRHEGSLRTASVCTTHWCNYNERFVDLCNACSASRFASQISRNCLLNYVSLETLRQLSYWGIPDKLVTAACKIVLVNKIRNLDWFSCETMDLLFYCHPTGNTAQIH